MRDRVSLILRTNRFPEKSSPTLGEQPVLKLSGPDS